LDLEFSHDKFGEDKNRGFVWSARINSRLFPDREENIGIDRYKILKIEPEDDYRSAMRTYLSREYLLSAYAFGKIITKYPDFHLVDLAAYFKGKSFENMRMYKAADRTYNEAIDKYPDSDLISKFHFHKMNMAYKRQKYGEALLRYRNIIGKYSESDVVDDANYIAGQIKFRQGQYQESIDLLESINSDNSNFMYAKYSLAIGYSILGSWTLAEDCLKDILSMQPANQSETDVQEMAMVKLAHLYSGDEPPRLVEAAKLYKQIPQNSMAYDEALLALSWSLIKVNKLDNVLPMTDYLLDNSEKAYYLAEAYLVKGYAYYMKKNWRKSSESLEKCIEIASQPSIPHSVRDSMELVYQDVERDYLDIQDEAFNLARQLSTPRVDKKRQRLEPRYEKITRRVGNYFNFVSEAKSSSRMEENMKRILDDAQFTLATVKTRDGSVGNEAIEELEELEDLE